MGAFSIDLRAWMARHGFTAYAAAPILATSQMTVGRWLRGTTPTNETAIRALMAAHDASARPPTPTA